MNIDTLTSYLVALAINAVIAIPLYLLASRDLAKKTSLMQHGIDVLGHALRDAGVADIALDAKGHVQGINYTVKPEGIPSEERFGWTQKSPPR